MVRGLAVFLMLVATSIEGWALPGSLTPDFGSGGKVVTTITPPNESWAYAIAVQPDGRIVAVGTTWIGTSYAWALARYNRDGSLDTSFGSGGKVTTTVSGGSATAVAIQSDGKIVVAGHDPSCRVMRYSSSGAVDSSFSLAGIAVPSGCSSVNAVTIDGSGRIVLVGSSSFGFVVWRFTSSGLPDGAFNGTGARTVANGTGSITYRGTAVAMGSGGTIVAAGYRYVAGLGLNSASIMVARLNDDGTPDASLAGSGVVSAGVSTQAAPPTGPQDFANAVAVQPGGEIVVAGSASTTTGPGHFLVARFTAAGALDPTFNGTGFHTTTIGSSTSAAYGVAIQPNGKIIAAGKSFNGTREEFAFMRFLSGGTLDTAFGAGGRVTVGFAGNAHASAVALQAGGAIFAAGQENDTVVETFAVVGLEGDDTTGPQITFTATPVIIGDSNATFAFTVTDSGGSGIASIKCSLDSAISAPCTSPVSLSGLSENSHTFWVTARDGAGNSSVAKRTWSVSPLSATPRLVNISTRGQVQTGFDVMIGGFVLSGNVPKTVVIRAIGPSLANYGVAGALANPTVQLVRLSDNTVVATNDDWGTDPSATQIADLGLAPAHPLESALFVSLVPGAYTAIVSGVGGATGVGLIEVYEVGMPEVQLINISTRGKVQTGFDVMIGGFVILGEAPQKVLIRAIGPSLANYGVSGALANPTMQLVRIADSALLAANDDWQTASNAGEIVATSLAPLHPYESAILITLAPGAYTAIVSGVGGATGVGLVEVYRQ